MPPASTATVGTAARAALRARNERRFVEDMVIPFDGPAAYGGWTSQGCSVQQVMRTFSRQRAAKSSTCCRPDAFTGVLNITAGQVRDHYRIPVILDAAGRTTYQPRRDRAAPRSPRRRRAVPSPAHEPRTSAGG